jgi:hypothetical protein
MRVGTSMSPRRDATSHVAISCPAAGACRRIPDRGAEQALDARAIEVVKSEGRSNVLLGLAELHIVFADREKRVDDAERIE